MSLLKELETAVTDLQKRIKLLERASTNIDEIAMTVGDIVGRYQELDNRVKFLESENARLKTNGSKASEPVEHKPGTDVRGGTGRVVEERGASVAQVEHVPVNMPNASQRRNLKQIVGARFPSLAGVDQGVFDACFTFLATCSRTAKVNNGVSLSAWIEEASSFVHSYDLTPNAFIAAAIAHNDIGYTYSPEYVHSASFSLYRHGPNTSTGAWRKLLEGSPVRDPLPGPKMDYSLGFVKEIRAY